MQKQDRLILINKICDRFESELIGGGRGSIQASLELAKKDLDHPEFLDEVLDELITLKITYAQHPEDETAEIKASFPGLEDKIDLILKSVVANRDDSQPKESEEQTLASPWNDETTERKSSDVQVGDTLGDYEVIGRVGAGGMGQVFKARHRRMKRLVALKTLPDELSSSPMLIRRFEREVEAAAKLDHPNIVSAYDAGEESGIHFLVMKLIDGEDVASLVSREGSLKPEQAVEFTLQAAKGLAYAHSHGIIHRDIKPANLVVDGNQTVQILDMGLARIEDADEDGRQSTELTQAGVVMGSLHYLPPEQAIDSRTADNRSDIYSLGCSLYQMLTGTPVYSGETSLQIIMAHREMPIPLLSESVVGLPAEFDDLLKQMIAKHPGDRFQDMNQCILELERLQPVVKELEVEVSVEAKKRNASGFNNLSSAAQNNEELSSLIQHPDWAPWQFKVGIGVSLLLVMISLASMFTSYGASIASELWLEKFDELKGTIFEGLGFEIGCARAIIYVAIIAFILTRSFRSKIGQIFNPRCNIRSVWVARIMWCLLALAFGGYESYRHLDPDQAPRKLVVESGVENPGKELVDLQRASYAAFLPYSLVNYMVVFPLLVIVPCASAYTDFPKVQLQGNWFDENVKSGKLNSRQTVSLFRKFESNCQAVCERYLSCSMALLVAINFECWAGRFTLSQTGFELMVKGWTMCGVVGVASFAWIISVYVKTNHTCLNRLVMSDSPDSTRFKVEHNGGTFLKWLLFGTSVGMVVSILIGALVVWGMAVS